MKFIGIISWYDNERGFGFIARDSITPPVPELAKDVYIRHRSLEPGTPRSLQKGDEVEFELVVETRYEAVSASLTRLRGTIGEDQLGSQVAAPLLQHAVLPPSLKKADLSGFDLAKAELRWRNLEGAVLKNAVLVQANLANAHLVGCDLTRAKLTRANLNEANLTGAVFDRVDLTEANLSGTNVCGSSFEGAILTGAAMRWLNCPEEQENAGASVNFRHAYLRNADLSYSSLRRANFIQARLLHTNLSHATFHDADFSLANLFRAKLHEADLTGSLMTGAILENAVFQRTELSGVSFARARLRNAIFERQNLSGLAMEGMNLTKIQVRLPGSPTDGSEDGDFDPLFPNCLRSIRLTGSDLRNARFDWVDLTDADFRNSRLQGARFRFSDLSGANLEGADLSETEFIGVRMNEVTLNLLKKTDARLYLADPASVAEHLPAADILTQLLDHAEDDLIDDLEEMVDNKRTLVLLGRGVGLTVSTDMDWNPLVSAVAQGVTRLARLIGQSR